jgi:hypothetical protein
MKEPKSTGALPCLPTTLLKVEFLWVNAALASVAFGLILVRVRDRVNKNLITIPFMHNSPWTAHQR